ncbi:MAG: pyruvate formate lyase-activating protein [Rhodospirillales bacterium]|nr:pyruvate formate lyase-activating protein [Rhodospirillales bacterium]
MREESPADGADLTHPRESGGEVVSNPGTEAVSGTPGWIHSYESAGMIDGPGIRFIVFLTGCPLSCAYCHNPDCMKLKTGRRVGSDEVMAEIRSAANFIKRAGGGVTISGGEPLVQPEFVRTILRECKDLGLHTALDTSGYLGKHADDEILSLTDLILLDIKSGLPEVYKDVTGVELQPTIDFARRLSDMGKPVWIRFVMVPGLTDGPDNVAAVAEIIKDIKTIQRVEILPFHKMGEYKWERLGLNYRLKDTAEPTPEQIQAVRDIFSAHGIATL